MKAAAIAFTDHGMQVAEVLNDCFDSLTVTRCPRGGLASWTEAAFKSNDAIIYVGALGIAVRAIAPYVASKTTDPCVIVIDERGTYVIPALSGHIGGGNNLAIIISEKIHAQPIITTATDINHLFAVDSWAVGQNLHVDHCSCIKTVSGNLLQGKTVTYHSDFPINGTAPEYLKEDSDSPNFYIGYRKTADETLRLVPKNITVGLGCRKGTPAATIEEAFKNACADTGIPIQCVKAAASIDLKKDEQGLLDFCLNHSLPFFTYSAEILANLSGKFSPSSFVKSVTGVDNVCERASVKHSNGQLLALKKIYNGVTVAFAAPIPVLSWEE